MKRASDSLWRPWPNLIYAGSRPTTTALPALALGDAGTGNRGQHHRSQSGSDGRQLRRRTRLDRVEGTAHGRDMHRRRAAAAADYPSPAVARETRVVGHDLRRAAVADVPVAIFRDAAIPLGNQGGGGTGRIPQT